MFVSFRYFSFHVLINNTSASQLLVSMAAGPSRCSVGLFVNRPCSNESVFKEFNTFSEKDRYELKVRSGVVDLKTCCHAHEHYFLKSFSSSQKSCHDPLKIHKKKVTKGLRIVSEEFHLRCRKFPSLASGHKLCTTCFGLVAKHYENQQVTDDNGGTESTSESLATMPDQVQKENSISSLDDDFTPTTCGSGSIHSVPSEEKYIFVEKLIIQA